MDKIDWVLHTSGKLHLVDNVIYARVAPATTTTAHEVFQSPGLRVMAHHSLSKNKLVGYSVSIVDNPFWCFESGGLSIGVFFSLLGPHSNPRVIFDGPMKIHAFAATAGRDNYAISIRSK